MACGTVSLFVEAPPEAVDLIDQKVREAGIEPPYVRSPNGLNVTVDGSEGHDETLDIILDVGDQFPSVTVRPDEYDREEDDEEP
jgi:hypothetical protein